MTIAVKAIAGIGSLCAIVPSSYAVYHVLSSNNTPSRKRLENSGYSLEPPEINHSNIGKGNYGCADRLFKEMSVSGLKPISSDETVYGCALMKLETTTEGNKFSDFKSHIAIRKGDNGWIINVSVSSYGIIDYVYIELKHSGDEWTQESWRWTNNDFSEPREELIIKGLEDESYWFNNTISIPNNITSTDPKTVKKFSKAWISSNDGPQEWILKGMMVTRGSEDKSQIFCSNEKTQISQCFQNLETAGKARKGAGGFLGAKRETNNNEQTDIPKDKIKKTYQTLSSYRGSWTELSEICNYGKNEDINADKQKKLEMFCAVVPEKELPGGLPPFPSVEDENADSDLELAINLPS